MSDLEPCPFCGGAAYPFKISGDERVGYVKTVRISCKTCSASVYDQDTRDKNGWACKDDAALKATAKWNRRADLPEVKAVVDALTSITAALDIPNQSDSKRGRYHYDWARIDDEVEKATAALAAIKEPKP